MNKCSNPCFTASFVVVVDVVQQEWSYHRVVWKDMDLDGDLDALTARFDMDDQGESSYLT